MPDVEKRGHDERIAQEIRWCFTADTPGSCPGASGRKLRQVCVWCEKYQGKKERMMHDVGVCREILA